MASIRQLPSGRWRALVRKQGSRSQSATFDKKREAQEWSREIERKMDSISLTGSADLPKGALFSDFIDKYVEETDPVKPHGKNKKATLDRLKREFNGIQMSDISVLTLSQFVDRRMKEKTQVGLKVSGVTIGIDLSYISTIMHWARDVKRYDVNAGIANEVRNGLARRGLSTRSRHREREATEDELQKIVAAYQAKGGRQKIPMIHIIEFALASAMRQAEICRILIEDLDFKNKTVIIRDRKDPQEKIGNDQVVPLFPAAWSIVIEVIGRRKSGRVFPFDERSVSASFTRICKTCRIEDLRFHDLRHTAIGSLFAVGLKIEQVALVSGHKDWKMLRRYAHIKANDVQQAFKYLSERNLKPSLEPVAEAL